MGPSFSAPPHVLAGGREHVRNSLLRGTVDNSGKLGQRYVGGHFTWASFPPTHRLGRAQTAQPEPLRRALATGVCGWDDHRGDRPPRGAGGAAAASVTARAQI